MLEDNASCDDEAERSPMIIHVKLFSSLRHAHLHNFASDTEWKINSKKRAERGEDKEAQKRRSFISQPILLESKAKPLPSFFFCCFYLKSSFVAFFLRLRLFPSVMVAAEHSRNGRERGNEDGANGK